MSGNPNEPHGIGMRRSACRCGDADCRGRTRRRTPVCRIAALALPLIAAVGMNAAAPAVKLDVDWPAFLARQDLVWESAPRAWEEAPFMGNGMLGTMLWQDSASNAFVLHLGRSDVQDHRTEPPDEYPANARARLLIGQFRIKPVGRILKTSTFTLDLWNAETRGEIVTDRGHITLATYVHSVEMGIVLELEASAGEEQFTIEWHAADASSPRQLYAIHHNEPGRIEPGYTPNPQPEISHRGSVSICTQKLLQGGRTTTAWRIDGRGGKRRLLASVAHSYPGDGATDDAVADVERLASTDAARLRAAHQRWWHDYYPASFLSISDASMEAFYWIQMYKLASATRADRALIDNQGPWLQETPWPGAWWNLNVQLTYWPVCCSNRLDLGRSLVSALAAHRQTLIENVAPAYRADSAGIGRVTGMDLAGKVGTPGDFANWKDAAHQENVPEVGLLTWTCHNLWMMYRYSMDDEMLARDLFPLLRRAVNYYLHFLVRGDDGKLHLPTTYSPEYGVAPDCNFDLSLVRWGCTALLASAERLGIDDPLAPRWREVLSGLTDYPKDDNGYLIGRGVPYAFSHRHYSHLLMIYPLYLVNVEQPGAAEIIRKSVETWQSKPEALQGYSCTGAASILAAIGRGDEALAHLRRLWDVFLTPNTFYREAGPVIETPLSAAQSIHDMILQSWGGRIRVFPSTPSEWPDISFHNLRTEGAFLVSAKRRGGRTELIRIRSLAGEPCVVRTDIPHPVAESNGQPLALVPLGEGSYRVPIGRDEEVVLYPAGTRPHPILAPVAAISGERNCYGINPRSEKLLGYMKRRDRN